jgi:phosphohistidine phosphatase
MSRTVLLFRHAKSDRSDGSVPDHERPLTKRGWRDARRAGAYLAEADLLPDLVLCSTARRARDTLMRALGEWPDGALPVTYREDLYDADPDHLLAVLSALPGSVERVMVVGHNPGLEDLLAELVGQAETMPTAAVAVVPLAVADWPALESGQGRLARLWRPKES